jgi:type VI secretion system secreted protein Hcp
MSQADYFLKIDGIEGESQDGKHKAEIELESWSWGATNSGTFSAGGGGGAGKVSMQDFHFVSRINKASPKIFLACAGGDHITKAVLSCRKAGKTQQDYLVVTFGELLISSYQTGGSGHGSAIIPTDQFSFNFSKIEVEYKEQKADGNLGGAIKAGWDVKKNLKV